MDTAWASNLEVRVPCSDGAEFGIGTRGADLTAWTFTPPDTIDTVAFTTPRSRWWTA